MSDTAAVAPPILPEGSPDREVNCEVALEKAFEALVTAAHAKGWTAEETAATLLTLSKAYSDRIEATVADCEAKPH